MQPILIQFYERMLTVTMVLNGIIVADDEVVFVRGFVWSHLIYNASSKVFAYMWIKNVHIFRETIV